MNMKEILSSTAFIYLISAATSAVIAAVICVNKTNVNGIIKMPKRYIVITTILYVMSFVLLGLSMKEWMLENNNPVTKIVKAKDKHQYVVFRTSNGITSEHCLDCPHPSHKVKPIPKKIHQYTPKPVMIDTSKIFRYEIKGTELPVYDSKENKNIIRHTLAFRINGKPYYNITDIGGELAYKIEDIPLPVPIILVFYKEYPVFAIAEKDFNYMYEVDESKNRTYVAKEMFNITINNVSGKNNLFNNAISEDSLQRLYDTTLLLRINNQRENRNSNIKAQK